MKRVLITGCTGFVGRALCDVLMQAGYLVRRAVRVGSGADQGPETVVVGDIRRDTQWSTALRDVGLVIHLAARVHVINEIPDAATLYDETNVLGTRRLAEAAAVAGVRRFVFMSSVKVNGENSGEGAYGAADEPHPQDPYGKSKWFAEQAVHDVAATSGMQAVIVRPPLVYGPGVKANFLRLLRWVDARHPLPIGAIVNRRSLVSVWTLCDLLMTLLEHPAAVGTWMVSDGEDLSTAELVRRIGDAMQRHVRLIAAPPGLLRAVGGLLGKTAEVDRLCGSLVVDISATREKLGWEPPMSVDEALRRTVSWYLSEGAARGA